jgi:hypothetical protein
VSQCSQAFNYPRIQIISAPSISKFTYKYNRFHVGSVHVGSDHVGSALQVNKNIKKFWSAHLIEPQWPMFYLYTRITNREDLQWLFDVQATIQY